MNAHSHSGTEMGIDFGGLSYRERRILELRAEGRTLEEVDRTFSVTRERVRQIQRSTIRNLARSAGLTEDEVARQLGVARPSTKTR